MPKYQVNCRTKLVVEAEEPAKAIKVFIDKLLEGGFYFDINEVPEMNDNATN